MKSKSIFMTIIAAAAVLAGGCSKFLDVHPKGEKINMFETAEEYEDALYGVYNELTGSNLYGQNFYLLPEVLSQNFTTTDYKYSELAEGEMTTQEPRRRRGRSGNPPMPPSTTSTTSSSMPRTTSTPTGIPAFTSVRRWR